MQKMMVRGFSLAAALALHAAVFMTFWGLCSPSRLATVTVGTPVLVSVIPVRPHTLVADLR